MAFEILHSAAPNAAAGSKPWLEDAVEAGYIDNGSIHEIVQIKESRKKSGYTIKCGLFQQYIYKSEEEFLETLILTLDDLVSMPISYALLARINVGQTTGFELGIDKEVQRVWEVKQKFGNIIVYRWFIPAMSTNTATSKPGTQKRRGQSLLA